MKNRIIIGFLILAMIIGCITGCGNKEKPNVTYTYEKVDGGVKITTWENDYNGDDRHIVFPEKVKGKKVISIAGGTYGGVRERSKYNDNLYYWEDIHMGVDIPNSVTEIGHYAFMNCPFVSVYIPEGVTKIGDCAFFLCASLESIELPKNVTEIGVSAFRSCFNLEKIEIPNGVKKIESGTFADCYSLNAVELPDVLTEIGERAFQNCYHLTGVEIPNVKKIGKGAFSECTSLRSVTIPGSVQTIEEETFKGCVNLERVEIFDGVKKIDKSAFSGCDNLKKITLPDSVKEIDEHAFSYSKDLIFEVHEGSYADRWLSDRNLYKNRIRYIFYEGIFGSFIDGGE